MSIYLINWLTSAGWRISGMWRLVAWLSGGVSDGGPVGMYRRGVAWRGILRPVSAMTGAARRIGGSVSSLEIPHQPDVGGVAMNSRINVAASNVYWRNVAGWLMARQRRWRKLCVFCLYIIAIMAYL